MHTNVFEKHDAADAVGVVNAAGADGAVDADAAVGVVAAGVVNAAGADGAAAAAADDDDDDGVVNAAGEAGEVGPDDCSESPLAWSDIALVSMGGGPAGLAELEMPLPEPSRSAGSFQPARWGGSSADSQALNSPVASTRVRRCDSGLVVGGRCDSMASGRVDDSGVKGRAPSGASESKDSSADGGSQSVGIGQRFADSKPIEIPPKLYRIGEIVEYSGLSRQTIHNYTVMGLLVEARRSAGGHRLYDESVFNRLNEIMALKAQHKSLAYIREYYAKSGSG